MYIFSLTKVGRAICKITFLGKDGEQLEPSVSIIVECAVDNGKTPVRGRVV